MRYLHRLFAMILVLALAASAAAQPGKKKDDIKDSFRDGPKVLAVFRPVVAKAREATVRVVADGKEVAFGVVVGADGWILTKWSEIDGKSAISCKFKDGKTLDARLVGVKDDDKGAFDLALLKVEAKGLTTIEWTPSKDATVGRWVASVGVNEDPVAVGVVSVAARKFKLGDQPPKKGINPNAGFLGVQMDVAYMGGGAKLQIVNANSPASKGMPHGLKANDIVHEAAGRKIADSQALIETVQRLKAGDKLLVKFKRGDENLETTITLGKIDPKLLGNPQETMGTTLSLRRGGFPTIIQHDSGVKPIDCGGPLVDLDGKAVGLNIARAGRTETYAIPSEEIEALLPELKSGKSNPSVLVSAASKLSDQDLTDQKKLPGRFYKVEEIKLTAGATYSIELNSNAFDAYLILQDSAGKKLTEDNDSGGGLNAKLTFRAPTSGVYRVIITSFNANETGDYMLSVRRVVETEKK